MDGLLVPPDKAYTLLTDQLITAFEPAQEKWFKSNHSYGLVGWLYLKHKLDVMTSLFFGKSLIKWGPRPDMTFAIDWDDKHHYAPNFEKVGRAYCFGLVRVSVCPYHFFLTFKRWMLAS